MLSFLRFLFQQQDFCAKGLCLFCLKLKVSSWSVREMDRGCLEVLGRVEKVGSICHGSGPDSRLGTSQKGFQAVGGLRATSGNGVCLA